MESTKASNPKGQSKPVTTKATIEETPATPEPVKQKPVSKPVSKEEAKNTSDFVLKPKKGTSAWIYFNTETVAKLKAEQKMEQKAAFVKSSEIWKGLTETEKEPYTKKAKADEERYQMQLKELEEKGYFTTADGEKSTDLYVDPKKKYGSDCILPKKPLSAYLFYTTSNVNKIKESEGISHAEAMKRCGALWNALSPEDKQPYTDKNQVDQKRYEAQLQDLDQMGYFLMDDGTKSSAHKAVLKKRAKDKKEDKAPKKKQKTS